MNLREKRKTKADDLECSELSVSYRRSQLQNLLDSNVEDQYQVLASMESLARDLQSVMLIYWRLDQGSNVVNCVNELLTTADNAASLLKRHKCKPALNTVWPNFGRAAMFSYLRDNEFRSEYVGRCKLTASEEILDQQSYAIADMHLAVTIAKGKRVRGYDEFLDMYFRKRRKSLVADTFVAYADLVQAVSKVSRVQLSELINRCEENYLKRGMDEDFKYFGLGEGTARFNSQQLDFRLATIIKWAYRDAPDEYKALTTIHQWRFD